MSGRTVGVVGLGLIGGSLARDLAAAGWVVLGTDRDPGTEARALSSGVLAGPLDPAAVDVLVLAVPVSAAPRCLREFAGRLPRTAVVTDTGSTKRSVVEAATAAGLGRRFVGSHPLAGHHTSGWDAGHTGLFRGATVWLCPTEETAPDTEARVESLWRAVGGVPRLMDAATHDRHMAQASHRPQVVASALALALAGDRVDRDRLGPGGRDMTRLAASDPAMWADILTDNRAEVSAALDGFVAALAEFQRAIRASDGPAIRSLVAAGNAWSRSADVRSEGSPSPAP